MNNVTKYSIIGLIMTTAFVMTGCRKKASESVPSAHAHSAWLTDFEKAKETAKSEGKDLLVNFAGSDWCYWCKKLDSEVFSKTEFLSDAQKQYVLVLLDYPSDKSGQSQSVQKQNERLGEIYGIEGYPTVLLMDAEGKVYAQTGYQDGGPAKYLEHLSDLRKQKPSS